MFGLSPEGTAALLGTLIGAVVGAGATLGIGFVARAWAARDARDAARRDFVRAVTDRLQKIVKASSAAHLVELNDEMFGAAGLGVYIPRGDDSVFIWYSVRDTEILQMAIDAFKEKRNAKSEVFNASIDVMSRLRSWARDERGSRVRWFKHQIATTDKAVIERANAARG